MLQQYISTKSLNRFITEVIEIVNDEMEEKIHWEYYLHKVYEKTYEEFVREIKSQDINQVDTADMDEIETTVKRSLQVLELFNSK